MLELVRLDASHFGQEFVLTHGSGLVVVADHR